jgi:hypothetical protein
MLQCLIQWPECCAGSCGPGRGFTLLTGKV